MSPLLSSPVALVLYIRKIIFGRDMRLTKNISTENETMFRFRKEEETKRNGCSPAGGRSGAEFATTRVRMLDVDAAGGNGQRSKAQFQ